MSDGRGNRGQLTSDVQEIAVQQLGREITKEELRLMPYIHYITINDIALNDDKVAHGGADEDGTHYGYSYRINSSDRKLLRLWEREGWISMVGMGDVVFIDEDFFHAINKIMYQAYVMHPLLPSLKSVLGVKEWKSE